MCHPKTIATIIGSSTGISSFIEIIVGFDGINTMSATGPSLKYGLGHSKVWKFFNDSYASGIDFKSPALVKLPQRTMKDNSFIDIFLVLLLVFSLFFITSH